MYKIIIIQDKNENNVFADIYKTTIEELSYYHKQYYDEKKGNIKIKIENIKSKGI